MKSWRIAPVRVPCFYLPLYGLRRVKCTSICMSVSSFPEVLILFLKFDARLYNYKKVDCAGVFSEALSLTHLIQEVKVLEHPKMVQSQELCKQPLPVVICKNHLEKMKSVTRWRWTISSEMCVVIKVTLSYVIWWIKIWNLHLTLRSYRLQVPVSSSTFYGLIYNAKCG